MAELDRWLASNPKSPLVDKARLARARLEAAHGDLERAIALFKKFLADCPQGALSETARAGMEDASRAKSIADAQKERERARADAARANPVQARVEAAEALLAKGKFREAVRAFGSLRNTVGPAMRDRVLYGLGEAMRGNGDSWGALETLRAVARSGAASTNGAYAARANRAIGDIRLEDTGDYDGAVAAYGKFLAMRPDLAGPGFWMNYGLALMASGRGEEAAQVFSRRRDQAVGDPAEFAKWDNMVKKCGQGRERQREAVQERGALAAMDVAEALLDGDEPGRALKMFRRVSPVARRLGLGDRCAIGEAECLAALGRDKAALKAYDEFAKKHPKSPLASGALLRAGVLCASPEMNDFREARKRFDAIVGKYPSAPEAEAAEFYSATLAWREGKWAEAGRLHRAFAERHPGSPLARVATEERLPAIAAKSLEVPRSAGGGYEYVVVVSPDDRVRHSIYVAEGASLNAVLKVRPESGWVLKSSRLRDMNSRGVGGLWTRKGSSHSGEHVYHLCNAFSSQEFAMIDGVLIPEGEGEEPEERLFRVAVPSVDVDWSGFASPGDENGEETRHILVPLNPNGPGDIRQVLLQSPYDDDERQGRSSFPYGSRVPPTITLKWSPANSASLLRDGEDGIPSGWSVNARNIQNWPVSFDVQPLASSGTLTIYCEGQSSSGGKASDRIQGRFVNVDLDVDANNDGVIDEDDEAIEVSQGGLVCAGSMNLAPVKLTVSPFGTLPGKIKLSATSGGGRIRVWEDRWRTFEVLLPRTWDAEELFSTTLYVEGVSPSATLRDVKLTLQYDENPPGQNNALLRCEDDISLTVSIPKIFLKAVSFSGDHCHIIKSDDGETDYIGPHWQDNSIPPDGDADDIADKKYPICFTRSSKMKASVFLSMEPASLQGHIYVRGDGYGNLAFPPTRIILTDGIVQSPEMECATVFANQVDFINPLVIVWKCSFDDCASWVTIGESKNPCYITHGNPNATTYHTLVHIGCQNASGERTANGVVSKIWSDFSDLSVKRISDMHVLTYYNSPYDPQCPFDVSGLLRQGDGRCSAWARFLRDTIKVQGISGAVVYGIEPITYTDLFGGLLFVKNQDLSPVALTPPQPPIPINGIAGQGCSNPSKSVFANHAVVCFGTTIYDPAYGKAFSNLLDWQRDSLDAIRYVDALGNFVYWINVGADWPLFVHFYAPEQ